MGDFIKRIMHSNEEYKRLYDQISGWFELDRLSDLHSTPVPICVLCGAAVGPTLETKVRHKAYHEVKGETLPPQDNDTLPRRTPTVVWYRTVRPQGYPMYRCNICNLAIEQDRKDLLTSHAQAHDDAMLKEGRHIYQ